MESFTPQEEQLLKPFFSNNDKHIFYLKNMPPVLKGALFSRYSRSTKLLRRLFLDQYLDEEELGLSDLQNHIASLEMAEAVLNTEKAQKFYSKWLAMYGDDSIAELGSVHVGIENISVVATKSIEDRRIGLSPLEKSTRYVRFDEKVDGEYLYYKDPDLLASKHAEAFKTTMDNLFDTYSRLIEPMQEYFEKAYPKPEDVSDGAYMASIRAKACDTLRGLLPMGTLTNMGVMGNGRAWEYAITRMKTHELPEARKLGNELLDELEQVIGNFLERIRSEKGEMYREYLEKTKDDVNTLTSHFELEPEYTSSPYVKLIDYDREALDKTIASIFFADGESSFDTCLEKTRTLSEEKKKEVIETYVQHRQGRWHKVGSAFEETYYSFEIHADLGVYKDLQRHRILSRYRQRFTTKHGYEVPIHVVDAGFEKEYRSAMDRADETYKAVETDFPYQAQYFACHGHLGRWRVKMNLREAFHVCELRSSPQGHPNYRRVAQEMHRLISEIHPVLGGSMKFVDMSDPGLERLSSEVRKEDKLKMAGGK